MLPSDDRLDNLPLVRPISARLLAENLRKNGNDAPNKKDGTKNNAKEINNILAMKDGLVARINGINLLIIGITDIEIPQSIKIKDNIFLSAYLSDKYPPNILPKLSDSRMTPMIDVQL